MEKLEKIWVVFFVPSANYTVDGRNPVASWDVQSPVNNGINYLSTGAGIFPLVINITQFHLCDGQHRNSELPQFW